MKFSGTQLSVLTAPSTSMIHDERGDPVSITEKQLDSAVELISPTSSPRSSTSDTINTPPLTSSDDDDVSLAEIKSSPYQPEALIPPVWSTPADRVAPTPRVKQANWGDKIPPGWKLVPPAPPPKPVVTPPKPAVEEPVVPMKSWYELTRPQHAPPPKPEVEEPFSLFVLASLSYTFHPPLAPKPFDGPVSEKDWNVKAPVYVAPVNPIQNSPPLTQTPASPPVMVRDGPPLTHRNSSPPITQNSPSLSNHFAQTPTIIVSPPNSPPLYSSTPKSRFSPPTPPFSD
ncbi:hypothetical protein BC829DRAFT_441943 [Chytridium lagenaria]|nr:hypothetical protein BC829DRAFT_441943 [Chytridium lagenaria]